LDWVEAVSNLINTYLKQVKAIFVEPGNKLSQRLAFVVFKLFAFPVLPLWKVLNSRPILVIGSAHNFEYSLELVTLLLAGEKRSHIDHFSEDAPN
jgi:hypothetical protein